MTPQKSSPARECRVERPPAVQGHAGGMTDPALWRGEAVTEGEDTERTCHLPPPPSCLRHATSPWRGRIVTDVPTTQRVEQCRTTLDSSPHSTTGTRLPAGSPVVHPSKTAGATDLPRLNVLPRRGQEFDDRSASWRAGLPPFTGAFPIDGQPRRGFPLRFVTGRVASCGTLKTWRMAWIVLKRPRPLPS